jgi:hypothetical protein
LRGEEVRQAPWLAIALLLVVPTAAASVERVTWTTSAPLAWQGATGVEVHGGVLAIEDPRASGAWTFDLGRGTIVVSTWRVARVEAPSGLGSYGPPMDDASLETYEVNATRLVVRLDDEPMNFSLASGPGGEVRLEGAADAAGRPVALARDHARYAASEDIIEGASPMRPPPDYGWTWRQGWLFCGHWSDGIGGGFPALDAPTAHASGPAKVKLIGGVATFLDAQGREQTIVLGEHADPSAPGTPAAHEAVDKRLFFEGEVRAATLSPSGQWGVAGPATSWGLAGALTTTHATGEYADGAGTHAFRDAPITVEGSFSLAPTQAGGTALLAPWTYAASGDITALDVDGVAVGEPALPAAAPARVAEATIAGALLLLAAVALYTRLAPSDLLRHAGRSRLYAEVAREPGIHLREAARRAGLSWSPLRFHVAMLRRAGILRLERHGGHTLLYPASAPAQTPAPVLHPVAQRILAALPEAGAWIDAPTLQGKVGVSRQLLSYHVERLAAEGHVQRLPGRPTLVARRP